MIDNGQAGYECHNCGNEEKVRTENASDALIESLDWDEAGDPLCPICGATCTYVDYINRA